MTDRGWTPDHWVPADRRWCGFDRTTLVPAAIVLVLAFVGHFALPWLDEAVAVNDPIEAGDVIVMGDRSLQSDVVAFDPPAGWDLVTGVREGDEPANGPAARVELTDGELTASFSVAAFDGDPADLLTSLEDSAALDPVGVQDLSDRATFRTTDGLDGLIARVDGAGQSGVVAVFTTEGAGVEVVVLGADGVELSDSGGDVRAMLESIRIEGAS